MNILKTFLERWGIHCFLLPLFFILHTYIQYSGLVSKNITLKIFFIILAVTVAVFFLLLLITQNANKSMQLTTLYGFLFLFYGVIKDFISDGVHLHFLSRYVVLLPLTFIIAVIFTILILKKRDFRKSNLYENILLLVFIGIECVKILGTSNISLINKNLLVNPDIIQTVRLDTNDVKPDVYYLLFDCYPGSQFLKEFMNFNNITLDSELLQRGFYIENDPKSNYNRTAFSISSILNFQYLKSIKNNTPTSPKDYNLARFSVKHSIVPQIFKKLGYQFYNLSIFDFPGHPSLHKESFLTLSETDVLMYNTLLQRARMDIFWNFTVWANQNKSKNGTVPSFDEMSVAKWKKQLNFNNSLIDSVVKIPDLKVNTPKFIYAHFYLPHPPFFYDKNGNLNEFKNILTDASFKNKKLFLSYLQYTNKQMLRIIDSIKLLSYKPPVIIVQSDHGFTDFEGCPPLTDLFFKNYSAFYFPAKNYKLLYDTMSTINTFPVLFNTFFGSAIPLQKDSSIFLPN